MNKVNLAIGVILLSIVSLTRAADGFSAPLGLTWGDSREKLVNDYGASLYDKNETRLKIYVINKPPTPVPGFEEYYGVVDDKFGLVKVIAIENINDDAFGSKGLDEYKSLKSLLTKKYSKPDLSYEYIGRDLYREKNEFYQCLAYQGCGSYSTFFSPAGGGDIALELKGIKRGQGFVKISYESLLFKSVTDERDAENKDKKEKGL
ncbi:hypothetical protein [Kosakonia sp. R1.Fl]|uniref:hypothetical protein n=1 Tax=Kosakonia sp. R1.Fl TaxID=2928706 RepID=UPI00201D72C6|nr:hypothetical protein [Kosakonia sp. R1.Fl]MCL6745130.1 hypothetical protein [Kosakonia sp. R1.Fl]